LAWEIPHSTLAAACEKIIWRYDERSGSRLTEEQQQFVKYAREFLVKWYAPTEVNGEDNTAAASIPEQVSTEPPRRQALTTFRQIFIHLGSPTGAYPFGPRLAELGGTGQAEGDEG